MVARVRSIDDDGNDILVPVEVGDVVGFKCDVEQCGRIASIKFMNHCYVLGLESESGFHGEYIHGAKKHLEVATDCWKV